MFNFIDKIILSTLNGQQANPMLPDPFEKPSNYRGWPLLLKYPLAMRYLKRKTETLAYFRLKSVFPIPQDEFLQQLKANLSTQHSTLPIWAFRSIIIYPLLLICLLTAAWALKTHYETQRLEQALSKHLIQYADLLHQNIAHRELGKTELVAKIDRLAEVEKQQIMSALPDYLRTKFNSALSTLTDDNKTAEDILLAFTSVNQELDDHGLPYYIVPKTFYADCLSFIDIPFELQWLLKKLNIDPKRCKTTMLITYKIKQQERFRYQAETLPVYHGYRLDSVPVSESALGVTYPKGLGSIVLLNSTRDYAINSILPALVYRGRHNIVPLWFKRNYKIEDEVAKVYQKTLKSIYQGEQLLTLKNIAKALVRDNPDATPSRLRQSLMQVDKGSIGGDNWIHSGIDALTHVLKDRKTNEMPDDLSAIEAIEALIIKSVAYHESYHQIPKTHWQEAAWVSTVLGNNALKDDILEEVGAYLVGLYYGDKTRAIQITQLFFFSVNIFLEGRPESYASRIILAALIDSYTQSQLTPRLANKPLEAYKTLNKLDDEELADLAKKAYIKLFERPFPEIYL
jgi:hypothetical protein